MGGIIKLALFLFMAMAFFTPPKETNANAIKCMQCRSDTETDPCFLGKGDSTLCKEKPPHPPPDICVTATATYTTEEGKVQHGVSRVCANWKSNESSYRNYTMDQCLKTEELESPVKWNTCICHKDGCNSGIGETNPGTTPSSTNSVYFTGWTMFQLLIISFGVIIHSFTQ